MLLDRDMMDKIGINAGAQLQIEDYLKAKRPAVATTEKELTNLVTDIMLSDRMAELFAGMIGRQRLAAGAAVSRRRLEGGAVCTLAGCGETEACTGWNRELEDVDPLPPDPESRRRRPACAQRERPEPRSARHHRTERRCAGGAGS